MESLPFEMGPVGLSESEVDEYLERIHFTGSRDPTIDTLSELHRCHLLSVPFENLSVYGKEEIVLSKDWLFEKVVRRHRGGYCYELNTLFCFLLDYFGFEYKRHGAQVFSFKRGVLGHPEDHLILVVDIDGDQWLTDVGFGAYSFTTPLRFSGFSEEEQEQISGIYRIRKEDSMCYFEEKVKSIVDKDGHEETAKNLFTVPGDPGWTKRYRFDLIPKITEDFDENLLYHQTQPKSPFTHDRICTMAKPWGRITLLGDKIVTTTYLGNNKIAKETKQLLGGEEEVVKELEQKFGIRKGTCFYPQESVYFHG